MERSVFHGKKEGFNIKRFLHDSVFRAHLKNIQFILGVMQRDNRDVLLYSWLPHAKYHPFVLANYF